MTRIGNVDHVLMLLQQQLQKLNSSEKRTSAKRENSTVQAETRSSVLRIATLAASGSLSEEQIERALVRALLVDGLGEAIADDHRFDRIAVDVHRIISSDAKTRTIMHNALNQARNSI